VQYGWINISFRLKLTLHKVAAAHEETRSSKFICFIVDLASSSSA